MSPIESAGQEPCVVRALIDARAAERGDKTYALFEDGRTWSYGDLRREVRARAEALSRLGVRPGDFVLIWLPNGPEALGAYFAANYLGAVAVPLNTSYRGGLLQHAIRLTGARLMIADARLVSRLDGLDCGGLATIIAVGTPETSLSGIRLLGRAALAGDPASVPVPQPRTEPWDTHLVLFTSGTTGRSKGVLCSYLHSQAIGNAFRHQGTEDRHLVSLPLFHATGAVTCFFALANGGSIALIEGFQTARFWDTVRRFEATTAGMLGVMAQFLLKQPPSPRDRDHTLKTALVIPLGNQSEAFHHRFGVDVYTLFNMTEISVPLFAGPNPGERGTCGRARAGVEIRLVDEHDIEVPLGEAGEMILRADEPWTMMSGYLGDGEATARTWRNGWFHTGDIFRRDSEGNFFFLDRDKDMVRRRGENISSFEVETEIQSHPDVREVAVVGVPSDLDEDEVMAVIAPVEGKSIDPVGLVRFLEPRLAYYMMPRFIRMLSELPKTPTQKVLKHQLRDAGVTPETWDRERAGIRLKRERFGQAKG